MMRDLPHSRTEIGTDADPNGYVLYRVSLPANDTPLATRILNSFSGFGQGTR